jgi:hypothetical protein
MAYFSVVARPATPENKGRKALRGIRVRLTVEDCAGSVWFTDVMLQGGSIATGWVGNVSELKWTLQG